LSACTCLALVCGLGLVGIGGFVLANMYAYFELVSNTILYATVGVMVLGAIVALINFFGCYGSCTKSSKMLTTFLVLKAVVFIVEVAVVVLALVYKGEIKTFAAKVLNEGIVNYGEEGHEPITNIYDTIQHDLQCCGVNGYKDWANSTWSKGKNVPDSCCIAELTGCGADALVSPAHVTIDQGGCLTKFTDYITNNGVFVIGAAIILIILEILTAVLSCVVCSRTKASLTV